MIRFYVNIDKNEFFFSTLDNKVVAAIKEFQYLRTEICIHN